MGLARRILVVGGDALIGRALVAHLKRQGHEVFASSRRAGSDLHLDLTRPDSWPDLPPVDAAILVAAVARLADCDRDPEGSRRVNLAAPSLLAERLAAQGSHCLFLSTDKVFDGSRPLRARDDARCPLTEYGRQKAAAEAAVLAAGGAVLRLSKVLSPDLELLQDWRRKLLAGEPITPFADMNLAPVTADFVAALATDLALDRKSGIFHCTGGEDLPYTALAESMASALGADRALIRPIKAAGTMLPGILVPYSSLEMSREADLYGRPNPTFASVTGKIARAVSAQPIRSAI